MAEQSLPPYGEPAARQLLTHLSRRGFPYGSGRASAFGCLPSRPVSATLACRIAGYQIDKCIPWDTVASSFRFVRLYSSLSGSIPFETLSVVREFKYG